MRTTIILLFALVAGTAFAQAPVIDSMLIDESKGILSVYGDFGTAQGKVWCDSVELPVLSWSASLVTATIPDTGKGSAGGVVVEDISLLRSVVRFISKWVGTITIGYHYDTGTGSTHHNTILHYAFRYDVHSLLVNHTLKSIKTSLMPGSLYELTKDDWHYNFTKNGMRLYASTSMQSAVPYYRDGIQYDSGFTCFINLHFDDNSLYISNANAKGFIEHNKWQELIRIDSFMGPIIEDKSEYKKINDDGFDIEFGFDSLYKITSKQTNITCESDTLFGAPPMKAFALRNNPSIIAPKDDRDNLGTNDILLSWDILKYMDAYHIQLSKDSLVNGQRAGQSQQGVAYIVDTIVTSLDFQLPHLEKNTKYYWRVCGVNTEGESRWSEVWSFTTGIRADVKQEQVKNISLACYPNPAKSELMIVTSEPTRLLLYDVTGKIVKSEQATSSQTKWDVSLLPNGTYILGTSSGMMQVVQIVK